MRKLFVILFLFCAVFASAQNTALDQMRNIEADNLANTKYYDQIYDSKKSQDTSLKSKHGAFTTMRENAGAGFDTTSPYKIEYDKGVNSRNVNVYGDVSETGKEVMMISSSVNVPPVSAPVLVGDDETDDMFMEALGGASKANSYKGNYETSVGKQQERNFDMSQQLSQAAAKQNQADAQFANDVAIAKQKQAAQAAAQALQAHQQQNLNNNGGQREESFWGNLGKTFMQGMVNVGIEATNYKYGTNIETIGNKKSSNSSGSANQSCTYEGQRFYGQTCQYCINNKPRSSSACSQCCNSLGRSIYRAAYPHRWSGDGRNYCFCMFNSSGTKGYLF